MRGSICEIFQEANYKPANQFKAKIAEEHQLIKLTFTLCLLKFFSSAFFSLFQTLPVFIFVSLLILFVLLQYSNISYGFSFYFSTIFYHYFFLLLIMHYLLLNSSPCMPVSADFCISYNACMHKNCTCYYPCRYIPTVSLPILTLALNRPPPPPSPSIIMRALLVMLLITSLPPPPPNNGP